MCVCVFVRVHACVCMPCISVNIHPQLSALYSQCNALLTPNKCLCKSTVLSVFVHFRAVLILGCSPMGIIFGRIDSPQPQYTVLVKKCDYEIRRCLHAYRKILFAPIQVHKNCVKCATPESGPLHNHTFIITFIMHQGTALCSSQK